MPGERESPSAGWRDVYREMDVDTGVEEATARCPDCERTCPNVGGDAYDCAVHGLYILSAVSTGRILDRHRCFIDSIRRLRELSAHRITADSISPGEERSDDPAGTKNPLRGTVD